MIWHRLDEFLLLLHFRDELLGKRQYGIIPDKCLTVVWQAFDGVVIERLQPLFGRGDAITELSCSLTFTVDGCDQDSYDGQRQNGLS